MPENTSRAVRFQNYGGVDVLDVVEVQRPEPGAHDVVVEVVAAAINPGEIAIREGAMKDAAPSTFPSGQGSDLAGRIAAVGTEVSGWHVGDEVIGWSEERSSQAEFVAVPSTQLTAKPANVPWEQAASLYVAGCTAQAMVDAVTPQDGETVVVAGAAGGVGSIAVQLLRRLGVRVLGVAGPDNADWLHSLGVEPIAYGDGLDDRLREAAPDGIDAVLDAYGGGYVELAIGLGVRPERVATIIDFENGERLGAKVVFGYQVASSAMLGDLAALIETGELTIPIAATYPLDEVQAAYTALAQRHTRGKIVLRISG